MKNQFEATVVTVCLFGGFILAVLAMSGVFRF